MAERLEMTVEVREWADQYRGWDGDWHVVRTYKRAAVRGPWREVPDADS